MLDEHDPLQWYDIVHFEYKLSQKASYQWREYSLIINPWSFPKLIDVRLSSSKSRVVF